MQSFRNLVNVFLPIMDANIDICDCDFISKAMHFLSGIDELNMKCSQRYSKTGMIHDKYMMLKE